MNVGTPVLVTVDPRQNNGEDVAPGLVTKVGEVDGEERLNVRVFMDDGSDQRFTNVRFEKKKPEADDDGKVEQRVAFAPSRR